jgi:D-galactose 1-dehydrogenase
VKPIKIAILGFGKIAEDQHVPAITGNPRFELVATSSRSGHGVAHKFTDWRELIRSVDGLEAVAITTPPGPRYEMARECILAELHCLLEKPPTVGLAEIADLDCLAQAEQVSLFTTWHAQHHATVEAAAQALAGKRIASMTIHWHEDVHKWHPGQAWIWEPGGFGVFDPGINALAILTRILPRPFFLTEAELSYPGNRATPIAANLAFSDGTGVPILAEFDWRQTGPQTWDIRVETDAGRLTLSCGGSRLDHDDRTLVDGQQAEYCGIYQRFVELITSRVSDVDLSPLLHVADAFMLGRRRDVEPFIEE